MLRITRLAEEGTTLTLSGRLSADNLGELETLLSLEGSDRGVVLDLKNLTQADQEAVAFLGRCEAANTQLKNCPAYIREWINRNNANLSGGSTG